MKIHNEIDDFLDTPPDFMPRTLKEEIITSIMFFVFISLLLGAYAIFAH